MLRRRTAFSLVASVALAAALVACGGSDDLPAGTLAVTPALGAVYDADVAVYNKNGDLVGTGSTGSTGKANIQLIGTVTPPLVIKVTANAQTKYYNEQSGSVDPIPSGSTLFSVLPAVPASKSAGVTALTNMVAKSSGVDTTTVGNLSSVNLTSTKIENSIGFVVNALGLYNSDKPNELLNILAAPVPATQAVPVPTDPYGKFLAVIAKNTVGATPLEQATALAQAVTTGSTTIPPTATAAIATVNGFFTTYTSQKTTLNVTPPASNTPAPTTTQISAAVTVVKEAISSGSVTAPTGATGGTTPTGATGASGSLSSN